MTQQEELSWDPEVLTANALKAAEKLSAEDAAHVKRACEALIYGNLVLVSAYHQTRQLCYDYDIEFRGIHMDQGHTL